MMPLDPPVHSHDPAIPSRRGVCRSCFDLYVRPRRRVADRCHACASGVHRSREETAAIQSFWVENPTATHLNAFAAWGRERELTRARRNLERFWRRAHRWSARA